MSKAEYEEPKALAEYVPDNVVIPFTWGYFDQNHYKLFFLTWLRHLRARSHPTQILQRILKKPHQSSASPTGNFGFHAITLYGPPQMINNWTDNWE